MELLSKLSLLEEKCFLYLGIINILVSCLVFWLNFYSKNIEDRRIFGQPWPDTSISMIKAMRKHYIKIALSTLVMGLASLNLVWW